MKGNILIVFFISYMSTFDGTYSIEYIPQIIEKIETAVILDKSIAYLNCTMVISENLKSRATWCTNDSEKKPIAWGTALEKPVRKDTAGNDKYIVNFIHKRPSYVPVMPGQSQDVWNYQLVVRDVLITDPNEYLCKIDLQGFSEPMKPIAIGRIIIQKAPFITPIQSQIVEEGSPLILNCVANGSPQPRVSWVKANGQAFPLPGSPQRVQNATLYLPKVGKDDRGVFRCHAVNNVGVSDQYDVMVEVTYKPTIRQARRSGAYAQMANQNFEIMIECIVNGYPDPDLYWYKGVYNPVNPVPQITNDVRHQSQKIVSYGSVGTNVTDVFFVLRILNVQEDDYSMFTCRAENRMGSDQTTVFIFKQQVCQGALCIYFGNYGSTAQVPQQVLEVLLVLMGALSLAHIRLM